jgi:hypothetical protein
VRYVFMSLTKIGSSCSKSRSEFQIVGRTALMMKCIINDLLLVEVVKRLGRREIRTHNLSSSTLGCDSELVLRYVCTSTT